MRCVSVVLMVDKIRMCDNCQRLGATLKHNEYGSVFTWCSEKCFQDYKNKDWRNETTC